MSKDPRVIAMSDFNSKIDPKGLFPVTVEGADSIVQENPFAFALAAVLDRGTKAEYIWTIPYHLQKRIGNLTPQFFAEKSLEELETLFRSLPNKPRYITDAPRTVKELSEIVLSEYEGNAEKIWQGHTSGHVKAVFRRIFGVGPGIASMIVLLLEKHFGIKFADIDHRSMDVKPDVHVVRVFQRMDFIDSPNPEKALKAARKLNPEYPGALDAPAWAIGRKYCGPSEPECLSCPVNNVCPKKK